MKLITPFPNFKVSLNSLKCMKIILASDTKEIQVAFTPKNKK